MPQIIPQSGQTFFKHQLTETVKKVKAQKGRADKATAKSVRQVVDERDGPCIVGPRLKEPCEGASEWAHCHDKRRSKTRGMDPERRHTSASSFKACSRHHKAYDDKQIQVIAKSAAGMNGAYVVRRTRKAR
jgi:hypothetical protein